MCLIRLFLLYKKIVMRIVCAEELDTLVLRIAEGIDTNGIITLNIVVDDKIDIEQIRNDRRGHIRDFCVPNTVSLIRMETAIEGLGIAEIRNVLLGVVLDMAHRKVTNALVELFVLILGNSKSAVEAVAIALDGTKALLTLGKKDGHGTDR